MSVRGIRSTPQFALEELQLPDPLQDGQTLSDQAMVSPAPLQVLQIAVLFPVPSQTEHCLSPSMM
jgi:hypothetical protein